MGLLDEAQAVSAVQRTRCTVAQLDDELRAEVEEAICAIDSMTVTAVGIARALASRGVNLKAHTILRHKRGGCSCGPA